MIYIADYFAISLIIILFLFYWDTETKFRNMPAASKLFACILAMTAVNAGIDLLTGTLINNSSIPLWQNMMVNSLYFATNLLTTSLIALYLILKILEHTHRRHCLRNALIALGTVYGVYLVAVIANIWTGMLFYFDEQGNYCRGVLNALGYYLIPVQMAFVLICYFRNQKTANKLMRRALLNVFPVIPVCLVIQRIFPQIMLNSIFMAFTDTVLFMTFMSQRHGVHALTEISDRYRFLEEVNYRIETREPFQIFLINIKNFGSINRKYTHTVGDEYLYQFAFALERTLKDSLAFHMNGTVFAVVLRYTYQHISDAQAGALLDFLERGIDFDGFHIESEYILSHFISDGTEKTATDVYEIMEHSIYKGQNLKRHYIQCNQDIRGELNRKQYLRERLEKIDADHGFEVWYQPIKCMETGAFCSMEALIRLWEPDGSPISPGEFIPLAEEIGRIHSVTWFVLTEVCRALKENPELADVSVSVNLPMDQLLEKGFVSRFLGTVDQFGIEHRRICIEFTERTILENFNEIQSIMQTLTHEGFRFYLDDFGVGYSNFNCLQQLPFQIIKLDSGFVRDQQNGFKNHTTVQALARIFHEMDFTVVAEGVETPEEVQMLEEMGIDRIQGYIFARPMNLQELLAFYRQL